mmetsp:Transcript_2008/g.12821  ORF Transcript_2008/g.12821 Transcript_2008/m.12821 type:complete len:81 (+) Transcript_2008:538-780(+)
MKRVKREPTVFNKFVQAELARMKEQVRPSRSERLEKFEFENDRPDQTSRCTQTNDTDTSVLRKRRIRIKVARADPKARCG